MTKAYMVVEDPIAARILRAILPTELLKDVQFINGKGRYGAESMARKLLMTEPVPVALVIDIGTDSRMLVEQQLEDLQFLLNQVAGGTPFQVVTAVPGLCGVFFQDRELLEGLVERSLTDLEWRLAEQNPVSFLEAMSGGKAGFLETCLDRLTEEELKGLTRHSVVQGLVEFLTSLSLMAA
jgi:hypothetical protein